jgi:hypothetical protein
MRRIIIVVVLILNALFANAQQQDTTVKTTLPPVLDSTLLGKNIVDLATEGGNIVVNQSASVYRYISQQPEEQAPIVGYRVRIFFDNSQTARVKSNEMLEEFRLQYPQVPVYLNYENPYFKVTVGDFRTKSDAAKFLNEIKHIYPSGFLVKEEINYPML